jgi:hypothetical protein
MNNDVSNKLSKLSTCNDEGLSYIERRLALRSKPASQQPLPSLTASQKRSLGGQVQQPVTVQQDKQALYLSEHVVVGRFPCLSYMALDFPTISSSSAETERYSSSAGRITAPLRNPLRRSFVMRAQCLRYWGKVGIYKPSIQFDLLSENWRDVVATLALED